MKFSTKDKKRLIVLIIASIFAIVFTYNNDRFYKNELVKITSIETKSETESMNNLGFIEIYKTQIISGIITNGKNKGNTITVIYEESFSSVTSEKYRVGDKVFVKHDDITGLKRDTYVIILICFSVILLYLLGRMRGLLVLLNVILNTVLFFFTLKLYLKGFNLLILCFIQTVIFTILSLLISSGKNKKTYSAIVSTLISSFLLTIMTIQIIRLTHYSGLNFTEMSYLTVPFEDVFAAEIILGALGAIMDVAISISSSISELIDKDNTITRDSLIKSGKIIGQDIMGTMMNVLFYTYLCSGLPVFILAVRNGFSIYNYIISNFTLEITRFLVGSIGIIITVPISIYISILLLRGGDTK